MFKQMLSVAFIPDEWKMAVTTPVQKGTYRAGIKLQTYIYNVCDGA